MVRNCMVFLVLAFLAMPVGALSQESPTLFQQIFPQPTGQNGYEEIVASGEMLLQSKLFTDYFADTAPNTLTAKRRLLSDGPVRDAMILFRKGLAKSLHAPRDKDGNAAVGAFAGYRRIARVLAVEQFVYCADGRIGAALDSLEDSLRLGYDVQRDTMMGGLVGVAIDALAVSATQRHLDQLSEKDCRRLIRLARVWFDAPDPAIESMASEREQVLKNLEKQLPADPNFPREQVLAAMRQRLDHYAANLTKPMWDRKSPQPLQGNKLVADYVNNLGQTLDPAFERAQNVFVRDQAKIQILGVHAAIRLYRWEQDALPASLEILKLGPLARDPFSGKPLAYKATGPSTYDLSSEGLLPKAP